MTEHAEAYEKLDRAIRDFHAEVNEGLMPLEWVLVSGLVPLADDYAGDEVLWRPPHTLNPGGALTACSQWHTTARSTKPTPNCSGTIGVLPHRTHGTTTHPHTTTPLHHYS